MPRAGGKYGMEKEKLIKGWENTDKWQKSEWVTAHMDTMIKTHCMCQNTKNQIVKISSHTHTQNKPTNYAGIMNLLVTQV